jgi:hypothetical protein
MGILIGGPDTQPGGPTTWGRLRRAVGQYVGANDYRGPTLERYNNIEWDAAFYFTSAASGGFVKGGYYIPSPPYSDQPYQPNYSYIQVNPASPPPPLTTIATFSFLFDEDTLVAQLVGEAVTGYGGTFNYTAPMNTAIQYIPGGTYSGTAITAIGKLAQTV